MTKFYSNCDGETQLVTEKLVRIQKLNWDKSQILRKEKKKNFWKICTIQFLQIKKFKRRDNSKLHLYYDFCWPLTTTENNQPTTP